MKPTTKRWITVALAVLAAAVLGSFPVSAGQPRLIQITADKDNMFKIPGQKKAVITAKANEVLLLRVTAHRGTESAKDGAVHTLTINALKDQGWDLRLKEGTQDFTVVAPAQPGEYLIECTIKCGEGHDDMKMKLIVTP